MFKCTTVTLATIFLLLSCVAQKSGSREPESSEPYMRGQITHLSEDSILVEENPTDTSGSAKAVARFASWTRILSLNGDQLSSSDLREGQLVSIWFSGPVMKSYPVQGTASRIVIGLTN